MTNLKTVIGIEIHIELNTKSKMFSSSLNDFHSSPNSNISPVDIGYPGSLPVVNKSAVVKAIKLAKSLNMKIEKTLQFDRKHYFYYDLPKGFQITQQEKPIGSNGFLLVNDKKILIERIHLEEDTAKSIHLKDKILLDYNRSGIPLIEIVSMPVIESAEEAKMYINEIRQLAKILDISDAKMEEGSLRADVNISLCHPDSKTLGTKVEIKNINSLSNVQKAIEKEIEHQTKNITQGIPIKQSTKKYDEKLQDTVTMRVKTGSADYKFFPEPNIPLIKLDDAFIDQIALPELPWETEKKLITQGVPKEYIKQLIYDLDKLNFFTKIKYWDATKTSKLFFAEIVPLANNKNVKIKELHINPKEIDIIFEKIQNGEISGSHVKKIIPLLINNQKTIDIINEKGFKQISDPHKINELLEKIILENEAFILKNNQRKERVNKFILGQIMKKSKGQINPVLANKMVKEKLGE